jgi:hypothetical protein
MSTSTHPVALVDDFLEKTSSLKRPYGVGDSKKATNRKVPKGPQLYSQPNPPSTTQPELVSNQKAVPPPPVT